LSITTPIFTVSGNPQGPALCLTAAVHGDELNGVEIIRRVIYGLDPTQLQGTIIAVPVVNVHGFQRASRYLPDRRDLNRFFPGDPKGSSAARIAHAFFSDVISQCTWLVDIHTGSFHRTNLPQLRANLIDERVRNLTEMFGDGVVLHSEGAKGTLRRAATDAGIPAFTIETGEPLRFQPEEVAAGVDGILSLMRGLGLISGKPNRIDEQSVFYRSMWLRADQGGILFSQVGLGDSVKEGQVLGSVTDPISNAGSFIHAPVNGRIVGMAVNQMVMPGFAAYHLGVIESEPIEGLIGDDIESEFEIVP
jgi:predicted deacylase